MRNDKKKEYRHCYLTIDDGPDDSFEEKVSWLNEQGIKAIWYCQGNHLLDYEEVLISAIRDGHIIGNHSYEHLNFETMSDEDAIADVEETQRIIYGLYFKAGVENPLKTFRYPYLLSGSQTFSRYLYEQGYRHLNFIGNSPKEFNTDVYLSASSVGTNFDTADWRVINEKEAYDEAMCFDGLKDKVKQWSEEESSMATQERPYTVVLIHCFTRTSLFIEMVLLMVRGGMRFELPASSMSAHLKPIERQDDQHEAKHQFIMVHKDRGSLDLVLLGDSITRRWEDNQTVFDTYMGSYTSINMGIGGDTINNLLWRIQAGELDGLEPTYISLLIGTNSLPYYPDEAVVDGIKEIVTLIRGKCPRAKLIYNHLFPRNPDKDCEDYLSRILRINQVVKQWLPGDVIQLSMVATFLESKTRVSKDIMPDGLHIGERGYHMWGRQLKEIFI